MHGQQDFTLRQSGAPTRRRRRRLRPAIQLGQVLPVIGFAIAIFALVLVARSKGAHAQAHVNVPIELRGWPGGPSGVIPIVHVSIGGGPPIPVVLDTGSTGLKILARKFPRGSHVWPMGDSYTETWGGGAITKARRALADVSIGGVATTAPIIIGMVDSAGCVGGGSTCVPWLGHVQVDGILGIRLGSQTVAANPLLNLPAPYSQSWRIALSGLSGTLELGAPLPVKPVASFSAGAASAAAQPSSSSPLADDADLPTLCWQVRAASPRTCVPTVFDTGSTDSVLFSAAMTPPRQALPAGVPVTGWSSATDPTPLWSLTSGTSSSEDAVLTSGSGLALMDTGIAPFYSFDFTYDAAHARMYLTRADRNAGEPAWRRSAEALCRQGVTLNETTRPTPPHGRRATLPERKQALIRYLTTWGRTSLRLDDVFARLQPPAALASLWARALASDRRASGLMLQYANAVPRLRTVASLLQDSTRFQQRYDRAEAGWETMMKRVKLAGCS